MNKPVSFIAYHGSIQDNLELAPNKAFYLCANYKLAKEFAYREVYGDGLYEGDVPMIYKFKGTFKNPYYLTEEEYDSEGQDSNIDFQKWVDMGVDGIVFQNRQTYYIVIDPSTIRLIGKKYLPFDEDYLERTDDQINDKDDIIGENVEYKSDVEVLVNPSYNEFKRFVKSRGWYRMCLTNDTVIVWDANTSILHQDMDNEYNLKNSEHIFIHKGKPYLQDYDLDDYLENEMDSILFVAKQIDNNPMFKRYFPNHSMEVDIHKAIDNNGKYIVEELNEQYISERIDGIPMIFPDPSYSEFHRIIRDHTTYGKLSAIIDRGHIYCWDSGMAHHHQMIKHIENKIGERLSDNAIWVRFKEPNWVWVSAEYFNEYDDDELDDLEQQDFEKELENNPIIKKYFPRGIVLKRFNNLVESFKKVSDDSYVMEITSYNDIKPFIQRYCSFGARGLLNTNNNKVYLADVMGLTHGDMVDNLKENGETIDYDSVIRFMVYPSQETALDSEYAEYWNEGDDRIQFFTNDDIYVLFKQYNFTNDRLNKILKMDTMNDVEKGDDMNGYIITESIHFNDMAYNEAFNKFEDLTVWKNPSIDWIKNQLKNIDLRFIYNPDADILYVWDGGKWMHSEVMDTVDMKMSTNVNIIGVFSPGAVEIWAEISPVDDVDEAKMLTRKHMGKLLKQIYPFGYQLIAYT